MDGEKTKQPDWPPPPPRTTPCPLPCSSPPTDSSNMPVSLLDTDQMLPPILPAKRHFQEDISSEWTVPTQKLRPNPPIRTTAPSPVGVNLNLPRAAATTTTTNVPVSIPNPQQRLSGAAAGFALAKQGESMYEERMDMMAVQRGRRVSLCDDSFVIAAETGARAQCAVDNASGEGSFETYELGIAIVQSSKLYANQRRSNRQLPGGSDSTTAACYMIGGTPDSVLSPLLARVSPCDPREERCKAVERVLKDKTRGAICALNGENPREARADNLAAVRICEVVADILVAFSAKRLFESRKQLFATVARQEETIKELRDQLEEQKRETERWRREVGAEDEEEKA